MNKPTPRAQADKPLVAVSETSMKLSCCIRGISENSKSLTLARIEQLGKQHSAYADRVPQMQKQVQQCLDKIPTEVNSILCYWDQDQFFYKISHIEFDEFSSISRWFLIEPLMQEFLIHTGCIALFATPGEFTFFKVGKNTTFKLLSYPNRPHEFQTAMQHLSDAVQLQNCNLAVLGSRAEREGVLGAIQEVGLGTPFYQGEMASSLEHLQQMLLEHLKRQFLKCNKALLCSDPKQLLQLQKTYPDSLVVEELPIESVFEVRNQTTYAQTPMDKLLAYSNNISSLPKYLLCVF